MAEETAETEVVAEETLPVPVDTTPAPATLFGTSDPVEVIDRARRLAQPLAALIEERQLYKLIRDRKHVLVEGWGLLGAMLECRPVLKWSRQVTDADGEWREPTFETVQGQNGESYRRLTAPGRGGWEARVEVIRHGELLSGGEMECRWSEPAWESSESYAVRSMAETRATSKAYRLALSFVMELGGFATTPAEEMTGVTARNGGADNGLRCPACGSGVYDNRKDPNRGSRPLFKCKSRSCTAGSKGRPWASYNPQEFASPLLKAKRAMVKLVAGRPLAALAIAAQRDDLAEALEESTSQEAIDGIGRQIMVALWRQGCEVAGVIDEGPEEPTEDELQLVLDTVTQLVGDEPEREPADDGSGYG